MLSVEKEPNGIALAITDRLWSQDFSGVFAVLDFELISQHVPDSQLLCQRLQNVATGARNKYWFYTAALMR